MNKSGIIKVGLMVVFAIIILIWGISYLKGKDIFNKENYYYIEYKDIKGLSSSSSVTVNGYKIGQVTDIELYQDTAEYLIAEIMIDSKFKVTKDAVAQIYSVDLMGTKGIRLINGTSAEYCEDGDTLAGSSEDGLLDMVGKEVTPLKIKTEKLMVSLDSVMTALHAVLNKETQENLRKTIADLSRTMKNLEGSTKVLNTVLSSKSNNLASIIDNLDSVSMALGSNKEEISNIINNFSDISDSLAKADIANTFMKMDTAILQLNQILKDVNEGDGSVSQLLHNDTLYKNLENATYHLNVLLRDMHENPQRYVHFSLFGKNKSAKKQTEEESNKNTENE